MFLDLPPRVVAVIGGRRPPIEAVCHAPQGSFAQGNEVCRQEKMLQCPLGLRFGVYFAFAQTRRKFVGFKVDQIHLVGPVKHAVRYAFAHDNAGHGGNHVIETFQVLHVERGPHGYARPQQFLHILISLAVTAALRVGVGQFVHKNRFRFAGQHCVHVQLAERNAPVLKPQWRHDLQPLQQGCGFRPWVGFHIAHNHVAPLLHTCVRRPQHGIGFAHASRIAKKYFQHALGRRVREGKALAGEGLAARSSLLQLG